MRLRMNDYSRRWDNKSRKWIYKHREIMEKHLGRKLLSSEHVHHKDGNHLNNSLDNLELTNLSDHMSNHKPVYKRKFRPVIKMCSECGKYPADSPSQLCSGCDSYREHLYY